MGQMFPDDRKLSGSEIVSAALVFGFGFVLGAMIVALVWWLT